MPEKPDENGECSFIIDTEDYTSKEYAVSLLVSDGKTTQTLKIGQTLTTRDCIELDTTVGSDPAVWIKYAKKLGWKDSKIENFMQNRRELAYFAATQRAAAAIRKAKRVNDAAVATVAADR